MPAAPPVERAGRGIGENGEVSVAVPEKARLGGAGGRAAAWATDSDGAPVAAIVTQSIDEEEDAHMVLGASDTEKDSEVLVSYGSQLIRRTTNIKEKTRSYHKG